MQKDALAALRAELKAESEAGVRSFRTPKILKLKANEIMSVCGLTLGWRPGASPEAPVFLAVAEQGQSLGEWAVSVGDAVEASTSRVKVISIQQDPRPSVMTVQIEGKARQLPGTRGSTN